MNYSLESLNVGQTWQCLYDSLPAIIKSPFFSPDYYHSCHIKSDETVECFYIVKDEDNYLFYPFIRKALSALGYELDGEYYDIAGAYGYNGIIGVASDHEFVKKYNQELQEYLHSTKVVTEFVRYCPITENRRFHTYTQQIDVLDNVYIDLRKSLDSVWNDSFGRRVRTAVRKGESYGLRTVVKTGDMVEDSDLDSFMGIYTSTMDRNAADSFYFFNRDFFRGLFNNMGKKSLLVLTYLDELAITTELLMIDGEIAFGFLGGTLGDYYQYKANTFQRWELIKYLYGKGFKKYSMGGGASRGDGIYDYKMSFAKGCVNPFFIGTKVHLPDVYAQIRRKWQEKYPKASELHGNKLQGYRIQL